MRDSKNFISNSDVKNEDFQLAERISGAPLLDEDDCNAENEALSQLARSISPVRLTQGQEEAETES